MTTIRYEVVYKNLIRSSRKFFCTEFKIYAGTINSKDIWTHALANLTEYAKCNFKNELEALPVTPQDLGFTLGSIITPKFL